MNLKKQKQTGEKPNEIEIYISILFASAISLLMPGVVDAQSKPQQLVCDKGEVYVQIYILDQAYDYCITPCDEDAFVLPKDKSKIILACPLGEQECTLPPRNGQSIHICAPTIACKGKLACIIKSGEKYVGKEAK
ncbi:hypothetical protein Bealeia1_00103 [Candidatus Bealeia paramacronuclearis]|uniref:NusG domain-containing protein n=1 Tax=Candidatus Bealeia paramacronuclearis TaxID=1921001 RepID=A0ABZ2C0F3_9PROT|nr:hypothetical protein [Candidatus Bealeia paramacronuclearis]